MHQLLAEQDCPGNNSASTRERDWQHTRAQPCRVLLASPAFTETLCTSTSAGHSAPRSSGVAQLFCQPSWVGSGAPGRWEPAMHPWRKVQNAWVELCKTRMMSLGKGRSHEAALARRDVAQLEQHGAVPCCDSAVEAAAAVADPIAEARLEVCGMRSPLEQAWGSGV